MLSKDAKSGIDLKCGGGLLPLDAHTIAAINDPSDDPSHLQL